MPDAQGGLGVAEAAKRLGISPAALRRRIDRRTVRAYKGEDGRWYVIVDSDGGTGSTTRGTMIHATPETHHDTPQTALDGELASTLREQLSFLQREIEARDDEIREMRRVHANQIHELHVLVQTAQQNEQRLLSAHAPEHDGRPLGQEAERERDELHRGREERRPIPHEGDVEDEEVAPMSPADTAPESARHVPGGFWHRVARILFYE